MTVTYQKDGIIVNGEFISLQDIRENCLRQRVKEEQLLLLVIEWRNTRGFDGIKEMIALPLSDIEVIKKHMTGREIVFGEIAGKHSNICGTLEPNEIDVQESEDAVVNFLMSVPDGHYFNYSFLYEFLDSAESGYYEDLTAEDLEEFKGVISKFETAWK